MSEQSLCKGPETGESGINVKDQKKANVAGAEGQEEHGGNETGDFEATDWQTLVANFKDSCFILII